jgi:hypothetical protein
LTENIWRRPQPSLFDAQRQLSEEYCAWEKSVDSLDSYFWRDFGWRRGRDLNPRHPMGELDFEFYPSPLNSGASTDIYGQSGGHLPLCLAVFASCWLWSSDKCRTTDFSQTYSLLIRNQVSLINPSMLHVFFQAVRELSVSLQGDGDGKTVKVPMVRP